MGGMEHRRPLPGSAGHRAQPTRWRGPGLPEGRRDHPHAAQNEFSNEKPATAHPAMLSRRSVFHAGCMKTPVTHSAIRLTKRPGTAIGTETPDTTTLIVRVKPV